MSLVAKLYERIDDVAYKSERLSVESIRSYGIPTQSLGPCLTVFFADYIGSGLEPRRIFAPRYLASASVDGERVEFRQITARDLAFPIPELSEGFHIGLSSFKDLDYEELISIEYQISSLLEVLVVNPILEDDSILSTSRQYSQAIRRIVDECIWPYYVGFNPRVFL